MRVTAKADYAVRASAELAALGRTFTPADRIAAAQHIPRPFLTSILQDLRRAGIIESRRGPDGGHRLAVAPDEVTIADVIRAVEGPIAGVAGQAPEDLIGEGAAAMLPQVWIALRSALREVLEVVTLADLIAQRLPPDVQRRLTAPGAWARRR